MVKIVKVPKIVLDKNRIGRIVARRASEREGDIADIRKAENGLVMAKLCHAALF